MKKQKKQNAIKTIKFWLKVLFQSEEIEPKFKLEIKKAINHLKKGT
jgi:hypothetical protein